MYDRILLPTPIPTDDRDSTRRPIDEAVTLAREADASIHAIHVVNERTYRSLDDPQRRDRDADGRDALEAVRTAAPDEIPVETSLRYGVAHREILEAATDVGTDVIVMGTCGRTGLDRVLAGSVAELVVRRASVPVLTVGPADEPNATAADDTDTDGPIDRALAALETTSREAADALAEPYRTRRRPAGSPHDGSV